MFHGVDHYCFMHVVDVERVELVVYQRKILLGLSSKSARMAKMRMHHTQVGIIFMSLSLVFSFLENWKRLRYTSILQ